MSYRDRKEVLTAWYAARHEPLMAAKPVAPAKEPAGVGVRFGVRVDGASTRITGRVWGAARRAFSDAEKAQQTEQYRTHLRGCRCGVDGLAIDDELARQVGAFFSVFHDL